MSDVHKKWFYLILLSLIWGTSYILIKKGLRGFTPFQLGAIRILISSALLLIIGGKTLRNIDKNQWKWVIISGLIGSFFPVFLFAFAQTQIDSSIASILNSLVPLFTIIVGYFYFRTTFKGKQLLGVLTGLGGAVLLILIGSAMNPGQNYWYALLVVVATIGYAFNANIIKTKLSELTPLTIAVGNFSVMFIPAIFILYFSRVTDPEVLNGDYFYSSFGAIIVLAALGTCVAKVMFNRLIQLSSAVFSVSITYLIPVVGIFWGLMDGEPFEIQQLLAASLIILGVYLINREKIKKPTKV